MCNSISQIEEVLMRGHEENTKYSTTPEVPDIEYYDYEEDLKKGIHKLCAKISRNESVRRVQHERERTESCGVRF